jgi:hypothetical protein
MAGRSTASKFLQNVSKIDQQRYLGEVIPFLLDFPRRGAGFSGLERGRSLCTIRDSAGYSPHRFLEFNLPEISESKGNCREVLVSDNTPGERKKQPLRNLQGRPPFLAKCSCVFHLRYLFFLS